jgi:hypothetical protein
MSTDAMVVIIVVALAVLVGVFLYFQRQRSKRLRSKFGPEYDHLVERYGDQRKAEADLSHREKRVEKLHIRDLSTAEADRFANAWRDEQARFVDNPREAVASVDQLVGELMKARGYPVTDFEQRAADISVDHPSVVTNYRAAHEIASRDGHRRADTEDLRQAMVHYRALFEELLEHRVHDSNEVKR